jgi:hypothetical protein
MTDKEFKELCEWAKTLHYPDIYIRKDYIQVDGLEFTKWGSIECNNGEYCLIEHLKHDNVKAIIENLL